MTILPHQKLVFRIKGIYLLRVHTLDHRPLLSISSKEHCLPSLKGSFGILFAPHISPLCPHCVYLRLSDDCLFIKSGKLMASKRSRRVSGREIRRRLLFKEYCTSTHRRHNMRGTCSRNIARELQEHWREQWHCHICPA